MLLCGGVGLIVNMTLEVLKKSGFVAIVARAINKTPTTKTRLLFIYGYKHSEIKTCRKLYRRRRMFCRVVNYM
jgi:hypothetical protein